MCVFFIFVSLSHCSFFYYSVLISARIVDAAEPLRELTLSPGDLFGVVAQQATDHGYLVRAETDCDVLAIDGEVAGGVASRNPALAGTINSVVDNRLRRLRDVVGDVGADDRDVLGGLDDLTAADHD